jgi:hypothetical protein
MAEIVWDEIGERTYQTGIDHGVLYLNDGTVAPWNGLVSVEEGNNSELKSFFLDGVKFLENLSPTDYLGKITAITYPDEFDSVNGVAHVAPGLAYYEQPPKSFNLSYRTKIGNDVEGEELGYKIHILYNIIAKPEAQVYASMQETGQITEFSWSLTGTPQKVNKRRPTVHISLDSRETPPDILKLVTNKLYGTRNTAPGLPPISEIGEYFGYRGGLLIIDIGDGTWVAIDESDTFINMTNPTTFRIDGATTTVVDPDTYTISSTNVGEEL